MRKSGLRQCIFWKKSNQWKNGKTYMEAKYTLTKVSYLLLSYFFSLCFCPTWWYHQSKAFYDPSQGIPGWIWSGWLRWATEALNGESNCKILWRATWANRCGSRGDLFPRKQICLDGPRKKSRWEWPYLDGLNWLERGPNQHSNSSKLLWRIRLLKGARHLSGIVETWL
jgi:hypothetical protein